MGWLVMDIAYRLEMGMLGGFLDTSQPA